MDTLTKFVSQMGLGYKIYIGLVNKTLTRHKIQHGPYELLVSKIKDGVKIDDLDLDSIFPSRKGSGRRSRENNVIQQQQISPDSKRTNLTLNEIRGAWDQRSSRITKEDWLEWLRAFNIDLIKESPSLALRSCFPIAQTCNNVARELFNPAFLSCWNDLSADDQKVTRILARIDQLTVILALWNRNSLL